MKNILMLSMKRSGHHAVLNWIIRNYTKKNFLHYNCCHIVNNEVVPTGSSWMVYYDNKKNTLKDYVNRQNYKKTAKEYEGEELIKIYSFEDYPTDIIGRFFKIHDRSNFNIILNMRDYYNMLSSSLRKYENDGDKEYYVKYKERAATWLNHYENKGNYIFVNFNRWVKEKQYRDVLGAEVGFTNTDAGIQTVLDFGKGSSFNGLSYNESAHKMNTDQRYVHLIGKYKKILNYNLGALLECSEDAFVQYSHKFKKCLNDR